MTELIESTFGEELYLPKSPLLVLINLPWEQISAEDKTLLGKILLSIKQTLASVQIKATSELDLNTLPPKSKVIAFGAKIKPSQDSYQCNNVDSRTVVQSDALSDLDDVRKKRLWSAIKGL